MNKTLIAIVGPTAIGKTSLSIALAKHFQTEIISADSRQFFKEMSIGTAAPTKEEIDQAHHHFINHKSIHDHYSVGDFEKEALKLLENLFEKNDIVIMVGGSGLYLDAVLKGLDDFPDIDSSIREALNSRLTSEGLEVLQNELKHLDKKAFESISIDNPHRVIRALEVSIGTGKPYSSYLTRKQKSRPFNTMTVGLTADRSIVYDRINTRVDIMMDKGLLEEVKALHPYKHLNSLNTVGYKELFRYLEGQYDLETAVSEIKKNTRRFAKRQLTWWRKNEAILWFDYQTDLEFIIKALNQKLN
jgi:tRNA dimethylallyltransferase